MIRTIPSHSQPSEPRLTMGEAITDPEVVANFQLVMKRFEENTSWFEAHAKEIGRNHPGKFISVVAGELFVNEDVKKLYDQIQTAHPEVWNSAFTKYIKPRS